MPEIRYEFRIRAAPARVFEALTKAKRVAKWWTPDCRLDQKAGGFATFRFKNDDGGLDGYSRMAIEQLVPDKLVEWRCVEQDYQGMSDWVGTTIRFELADDGQGGTELDFAHLDWKNTEGSFERCSGGWMHVLGTSLKNYLEKGKGEPYLAHVAKEAELREYQRKKSVI